MKKYLYIIIGIILLFGLYLALSPYSQTLVAYLVGRQPDLQIGNSAPTFSPSTNFKADDLKVVKSNVSTSSSGVVNQKARDSSSRSFSYLFEGKREQNTSNIVGYLGGGAFAWYVPDWLVTNWRMIPFGHGGMSFVPLVRDNPYDFSDITFDVSTSTESNNADNLYETRLNTDSKTNLILNEVLLNKHSGDMISMDIETDTRIYHITELYGDGIHTRDTYFMDGNGKTLVITFTAKSDIFQQFTEKIRMMVEGIGELKSPQG